MGIDLSSRILKYRKEVNERVNCGDDRLCSVQTTEESEDEMKNLRTKGNGTISWIIEKCDPYSRQRDSRLRDTIILINLLKKYFLYSSNRFYMDVNSFNLKFC